MSFKCVISLFLLALSYKTLAGPPTELQLKGLASSREWKLLLHDRKLDTTTTHYRSEADGLGFFFAGEAGRRDALHELKKSIQALEANIEVQGIIKQSARCAFPARRRLIEKILGLKFPDTCAEYAKWLGDFNGEQLSLVFAAPYMGSPASMFGHIFLRVHKKNNSQPLLDQSIGFEALTTNSSGMSYAFKGLVGFFPGIYTVLPYHVKVNQYTNLDSRDLWEYKLSLSTAEIEILLEHLWELQNTYFDYYFFDENCSYHLLSLLEVAKPEWDLRSIFTAKTIPIDAVKAVISADKNYQDIKLRPAIQKTIRKRLAKLSFSEVDLFYKYRHRLNEAPETASVGLIDAWLDWEQYEKFQNKELLLDLKERVNYRLLLLRSKKQSISENREDFKETLPHLGHASTKTSLYTFHSKSWGLGIKLRPAFHELSEWSQGYLESSSLEVLELQIEKQKNQKLRIEQFNMAQVENLAAFDRLAQNISWNIGAAFRKPFEQNYERCLDFNIVGGGGYTFNLWQQAKVFSLASADLRVSNRYENYTNAIPFLRSGVLWDLDFIRLQGEYHLLFVLPAHTQNQVHNFDSRVLASANIGKGNLDFKVSFKKAFLKKATDKERIDFSLGYFY